MTRPIRTFISAGKIRFPGNGDWSCGDLVRMGLIEKEDRASRAGETIQLPSR